MHILMTNHTVANIGGTETWLKTMSDELLRRGHKVEVFTLLAGKFAKHLNCPVTTELRGRMAPYDLIIANHNTCLGMLTLHEVEGPKVFTSHGPAHKLEQANYGADYYVSVSEEVLSAQAALGFFGEVVRNPIDLEKFRPQDDAARHPMLIMCKNADAMRMARRACELAGIAADVVHYEAAPADNVHEILPLYEAVITSGRGVYEALACGCDVFIFDVRSGIMRGDGWVTSQNMLELVQYNCSGRAIDKRWSGPKELADDLAGAGHPLNEDGWSRDWVERKHDVRKNIEKYLAKAAVTEEVAA